MRGSSFIYGVLAIIVSRDAAKILESHFPLSFRGLRSLFCGYKKLGKKKPDRNLGPAFKMRLDHPKIG